MKTSLPILLWLALLLTPKSIHAQVVNDGATNILSNVTNHIPGGVTVGTNGSFALLVLANNCLLTNSGISEIGRNTTARSNEVRLTSASARWHMLNPLQVGVSGSFNRLAISNGAAVHSSQGVIGNSSASASNNTVIVNGAGSVWSVATSFIVGLLGSNNRLEVSDGGHVNADSGSIGEVASNNAVLVMGSGSVWSNATDLTVGSSRSANRLVVSNAGSVFAGGTVLLGNFAASSNNQLTVNGGTLRVTNASATGTLNVRRGTATLDAGSIEVDRLLVTNSQGSFVLNGGTLSSKSTIATNQFSFDIGNNVGAATFILAGNGTHTFTALTVDNLGTLTGNGTVILPAPNLVVVLDTGTISPGASIGKIVFHNQLLVFGTTLMEISKNGVVLTNDQIQIAGGLTHNGHLMVTNIGPTSLAAGDRFPLFSASFATGSLLSLTLPPLGPGLSWTNKFILDGSIEVLGLIAQTLPASAVALHTATLNGVVIPRGSSTGLRPTTATSPRRRHWAAASIRRTSARCSPICRAGSRTISVLWRRTVSELYLARIKVLCCPLSRTSARGCLGHIAARRHGQTSIMMAGSISSLVQPGVCGGTPAPISFLRQCLQVQMVQWHGAIPIMMAIWIY